MLVSSFPGASREETVDGVRLVRLGPILLLWATTLLYYRRYCRGRYDVVVEEGFGGSRIPRLAPLYVREPIVTEWYQSHQAIFANQYPAALAALLALLERFTAYIHRNTLVQALAPEWQEVFSDLGFKKENIAVVPVSIREEWLQDGATPGAGEPRVVWLGKFRRYKCAHHVVLAMKEVVRAVPGARLVLAGRHDDKRYEEQLQRLVRDVGLTKSVTFEFDLTEERKKDLLRNCRALVLPSPVEGFGIVVLEANACGMPVIASSGVPESVVQDGYNGLRYAFGEVDALSQTIVGLLQDSGLRRRLAANSRAFADQFTWSKVGLRFEGLVLRATQREALLEAASV